VNEAVSQDIIWGTLFYLQITQEKQGRDSGKANYIKYSEFGQV
jgi:hypothetical protein